MRKIKTYDELTFTDDFIFCKVLEESPELCRELLEIILEKKISKVVVNKQKSVDIMPDAKSVRFDVYVEENGKNVIYDIEMQTSVQKDIGKRSRYYQGMIDMNLINKGAKYAELKQSYIIFICTFDPFGQNRCIYTFENRCTQDSNLKLGDETIKVFINPYGDQIFSKLSKEMQNILEYLTHKTVEGDFVKRLDKAVKSAKTSKEWRTEYMTLMMRDQENREFGKASNLINMVNNLAKKMNMSIQEACDLLDITEIEYQDAKELIEDSE